MRKQVILYIIISALCIGCKEKTVIEKKQRETFYNSGSAVFYGAYYEENGILQNVISLDLYTPGVSLDSTGHIIGTGVNLYFSDIFIAPQDTLLPAGTYESDTTALPYTYLPGMDFDGNISGAYLLDISDGALSSVEILSNGHYNLQYKGDSLIVDFVLQNENRQSYSAQYRGRLPLYDGRKP
ncbi:MAG: hypothetical protein NC038_01805 [Paludibacter sp.]|nr:hypothetical protein [Bacteroidales bacterium]MCM1068409.1 hypothetical protein [Prevotella sp.]MCM1353364.1 hypothetical protein [Bacteroides sp.]MCM1442525.1 hypothetical protein [Muribaculum sp.]MCM1481370.1 hypothetical protein [Paludibacter sp.]